MKIADINPHIRFAEQITYPKKNNRVWVKDCRLFYIISGNGKIFTNNNTFPLTKNTLFYCCGGSNYAIDTIDPLHLYSLNFDLSQTHREMIFPIPMPAYDEVSSIIPVDRCDITDSSFMNSFLILKNAINFQNTVSSIVTEFSSQKLYFREFCSSQLKELLIELHRTDIETPDNASDTINKIVAYITEKFTSDIRNATLAEIAGYHEYYLNRLFISHTGTSMHKYILNLRMNEGKRLLLNTNIPIADIALQIGFNSNTHFSSYFKKEMNMTPIEYRRNFKNNI